MTEPIFYINGDPVKGISNLEIYETDGLEYFKEHTTYSLHNNCLSFIVNMKNNEFDLWKLLGIYSWVIDNCHNRRVAHLIKHGKNNKVCKKNFNRALKIIVKELV